MPYLYLDRDVAYLLGLLVAGGKLCKKLGVSRLLIEFPSRVLRPRERGAEYEADISRAITAAKQRVGELVEPDVGVQKHRGGFRFCVAYRGNPFSLRALTRLLVMKESTQSWIPGQIFGAEATIRREFIRGFADASCNPFLAEQDENGHYTVHLEIQKKAESLTAQLIALLKGLGAQVKGATPATRRRSIALGERQISATVETFRPVGFFFQYKQRQLDKLVTTT